MTRSTISTAPPRAAAPSAARARARTTEIVPSATSVYPGANLQEREVYDLFGIKFAGHPNLRRILLWEGFHGHPMRKDWKEAYFEEETKPFKSRHPGGHYVWARRQTALEVQLDLPRRLGPGLAGSEPVTYVPVSQAPEHGAIGDDGHAEHRRQPGPAPPQHPRRLPHDRRGSRARRSPALEPEMGYLHRNHEKIGERNTWLMNMPFTDRLDYINSHEQQPGLRPGRREAAGDIDSARARRSTSA